MKYMTGILIGTMVGAAALMVAEVCEPSVYRVVNRHGKCIVRMCRKKMKKMNMI